VQHGEQHDEGAVAFWEYVAVHWTVLLRGGRLCDGRRAHWQRHLGGHCGASVGVVRGEMAVRWTRHGGGGGERRWCVGPRGGRGMQRLGTTWRCTGRCFRGRGSGATNNGGGCSGVFVFYLHMGMGKIHWREEGDPIIDGIKDDREIFFYIRDVTFSVVRYLFFGACFYL
jgi:hypothetical protein